MKREHKRRQYDSGYFKTHACLDPFTCRACGRTVTPGGAGTDHRNHCPYCLASMHVDMEPGDRAAECHGTMDAVAVWVRKGGEWALIHRCRTCGKLDSNRIAADDNPMRLMALALRPAAYPLHDPARLSNMLDTMEE